MLKLLLVSLLAIHCNSQIIGGGDYGRTVLLAPHLNGVSSIGSYGLGSLGYTSYGGLGQLGTQSLYGLRPLGGIGLNSYVSPVTSYQSSFINPANFGFGYSSIGGLRPQALNLVSAANPVTAISARNAVAVNAAVRQVGRTVEYRPVPYVEEPIEPHFVVVEPGDNPIHIHFKSRSSTVRLSQEHVPGQPGPVEHTRSQDEPSRVVHEVSKPVIQEVREIVQPYRKVIQELHPVIENVHTVVSKGEGQRRRHLANHDVNVHKNVQIVSQPINTYQTVAQQFDPYQTAYNPYGGYQTINYGAPTIGQSIFEQAYNSFGQPAFSSYGSQAFPASYGSQAFPAPIGSQPFPSSFGTSFGTSFNTNRGTGDNTEYSRTFNPGFATGNSGQQPEGDRNVGGRGPNGQSPEGGNGQNGQSPAGGRDQSTEAQPNEGNENSNTDNRNTQEGNTGSENTDNANPSADTNTSNDSSSSTNDEE